MNLTPSIIWSQSYQEKLIEWRYLLVDKGLGKNEVDEKWQFIEDNCWRNGTDFPTQEASEPEHALGNANYNIHRLDATNWQP